MRANKSPITVYWILTTMNHDEKLLARTVTKSRLTAPVPFFRSPFSHSWYFHSFRRRLSFIKSKEKAERIASHVSNQRKGNCRAIILCFAWLMLADYKQQTLMCIFTTLSHGHSSSHNGFAGSSRCLTSREHFKKRKTGFDSHISSRTKILFVNLWRSTHQQHANTIDSS